MDKVQVLFAGSLIRLASRSFPGNFINSLANGPTFQLFERFIKITSIYAAKYPELYQCKCMQIKRFSEKRRSSIPLKQMLNVSLVCTFFPSKVLSRISHRIEANTFFNQRRILSFEEYFSHAVATRAFNNFVRESNFFYYASRFDKIFRELDEREESSFSSVEPKIGEGDQIGESRWCCKFKYLLQLSRGLFRFRFNNLTRSCKVI